MKSFFAKIMRLVSAIQQGNRRRRRGCALRLIGCLGILGLLAGLALLMLFALIGQAGALEPEAPHQELAVQLVIDNSNSMFDKDGVGSDPELLRMAAARLFIEYLGVDDQRFHPSCGIIFFGTQARQVSPPVGLADSDRRAALIDLLTNPERLGWTDHLAALQTAQAGLEGVGGRRAIVILTDGKPEWSYTPSPQEQAEYAERMADFGQQIGDEGIALYIVLLVSPLTDTDVEIANVWQPIWKDMAAATPGGRFLVARDAQDLPAIYHDFVVSLTGRQSAGAVVDTTVAPEGFREVVTVDVGLARLILIVRKSHPDTAVTIHLPDGTVLRPSTDARGPVHRTGGLLEEVWTIRNPAAGNWLVTASGEGRLTVWKDFEVATPTPPPTATQATATATMAPATTTAAPTRTPASTATPALALIGQPTSTPLKPAAPDEPQSNVMWPIMGVVALMVGSGGGYFLLRRRNNRLVVTGTLHVLDGSETPRKASAFDLYALGKSTVTIGAGEADIHLPAISTPVILWVKPGAAGETEIVAQANPDAQHNGRRLLTDQPVYDGDIISVGQTRLRYENLQRRRPRERRTNERKPRAAAPFISQ